MGAEGAACGAASISLSVTVVGLGGVLLLGERPAGGEVDRDARFAMACVRSVRCDNRVSVFEAPPPRRKWNKHLDETRLE